MTISIIAAVAENGAIGKDGKLPWYSPEDMKHFRDTTLGHCVIMGRKTYESIGKPLFGRQCIVLSRSGFRAKGVRVVESLSQAISVAMISRHSEIFIAGGEEVYREAMPIAKRLYITRVERSPVDADAFFPEIGEGWQQLSRKGYLHHLPAICFEYYER